MEVRIFTWFFLPSQRLKVKFFFRQLQTQNLIVIHSKNQLIVNSQPLNVRHTFLLMITNSLFFIIRNVGGEGFWMGRVRRLLYCRDHLEHTGIYRNSIGLIYTKCMSKKNYFQNFNKFPLKFRFSNEIQNTSPPRFYMIKNWKFVIIQKCVTKGDMLAIFRIKKIKF